MNTRHFGVAIRRSAQDVYHFVRDPRHLPQWAAGLASAVEQDGDDWRIITPQGPAMLRFASINDWGILDHTVTFSGGPTIHVPLRVIETPSGCELVFSLFRQPGMTDAQFDLDHQAVIRDLTCLQALLEHHDH